MSAALAAALLMPGLAHAQGYPSGPPPQGYPGPAPQGAPINPVCPRLEGQLAAIDRGGGDQARDEQARRYEDAAAKQQRELDRVTVQAKRMGCDSSGFFSLFNGPSAQCGPVNNQIQQMRTNLEQITTSLERLRGGNVGGNPDRDNQRRSVLLALAQNNCGPQYANAARNSGGFFENLFGGNNSNNPGAAPPADAGPPASTFRTVCVRSCDGYYFPISFATVPGRFGDDEKTCKNLCPAAEATLFAYRNPGEDINQAVSINGQPYSSSPNAFKFRTEFNPSCSCKAAGQTWAEALKNIDDKTAQENGDITVTEESARKMAQPVKTVQKKGAPAAATPAATPPAATSPAVAPADTTASAPANAAPANATPAPANTTIRSVGPAFIPTR